jgi:hypothetical protein
MNLLEHDTLVFTHIPNYLKIIGVGRFINKEANIGFKINNDEIIYAGKWPVSEKYCGSFELILTNNNYECLTIDDSKNINRADWNWYRNMSHISGQFQNPITSIQICGGEFSQESKFYSYGIYN